MMNITDLKLDDNPLTQMALAVMAGNALWLAQWAWSMQAYRMAAYAWGYPRNLRQ